MEMINKAKNYCKKHEKTIKTIGGAVLIGVVTGAITYKIAWKTGVRDGEAASAIQLMRHIRVTYGEDKAEKFVEHLRNDPDDFELLVYPGIGRDLMKVK